MASAFKATLRLCGLTISEAAEFLDVRRDTVVSWSAGRNPAPKGVWIQLAELFEEIASPRNLSEIVDQLPKVDGRLWPELVKDLETGLPDGADANAQAVCLLRAIAEAKS